MPNIVKTRFAGFLRGLLRHMDDGDVSRPEPSRPLMQTAPPPMPAAPAAQTETFSEQQPEQPQAQTAPVLASSESDELTLPLQPILAGLPMDLRGKILQMPPAGSTLIVPVGKVLSQLAHGSVKVTFGELREASPEIFVRSGGEHDSRPVNLPLNDILVRLSPSLLRRNVTQRRVEVAEEIAGPFGSNTPGVSFTTAPLKSAPAAPPAPLFTPPVVPQQSMPTFAQRNVTPPAMSKMPTALRPMTPPAHQNGNGNGNGVPDIFATPKIFPAAPVPPATPVARIPEQPQPTISAPLNAMMESWPEGLRMEILQTGLNGTQAALPLNLVEPGLKRGRITIKWKELRAMIQPPPGVSAHDGIELELPLKVLAPLFFARQKAGLKPQQKLPVAEEIPNLFFGFPQPAPAPAPVAPLPQTPLPPSRSPLAQPSRSETDVFLRKNVELPASVAPVPQFAQPEFTRPAPPSTDFLSRFATPQQIVEQAMDIPGVAGAVVALPDGLKVASEVPSDLSGDTIAAFLPQLISRVNQASRELRMGDLNHLSFVVGQVQWEIFRVGGVFLAVFSHSGEPLPAAQVAELAAQLERKK